MTETPVITKSCCRYSIQDWRKFALQALNKKASTIDIWGAKQQSSIWGGCYLGLHKGRFQRHMNSAPVDPDLRKLGERFVSTVVNQQWSLLLDIMDAIDERVKQVVGILTN